MREEERLDLADRRQLAPGRDRAVDALPRDARPLLVRTSRSRSGRRSSSVKISSASKWLTIARANAGPIPATRAVNQRTIPSGDRGSTSERLHGELPAVPRMRHECPRANSCSPAVKWPSGPASVTGSPSRLSPTDAVQTANSRSGDTKRGPDSASDDLDPPGLHVCRRRGCLDVPHADDDMRGVVLGRLLR